MVHAAAAPLTEEEIQELLATITSWDFERRGGARTMRNPRKEYFDAIKSYSPSQVLNSAAAQGWAAGKLFQRVGQAFGDGPVTRDQIFDGLWGIKDDTLGGLTPALSFVKNQPAPPAKCVFPIQIQGGKWIAPQGANTTCTL